MEELIRSALSATPAQASPNRLGIPVVRLGDDVSVYFKSGYVDIIQGIHLIVRVDHNTKTFALKHGNARIVRVAESALVSEGYTRVV